MLPFEHEITNEIQELTNGKSFSWCELSDDCVCSLNFVVSQRVPLSSTLIPMLVLCYPLFFKVINKLVNLRVSEGMPFFKRHG